MEAARRAKRRQTLTRMGILGGFVIVLAVVAAFVFGNEGDKNVTAGDNPESTSTTQSSDTTAAPAGAGDDVACDDREPEGGTEPKTYDKPPEMQIDPEKTYTAKLDTSCGEIVIDLDAKGAPKTVNNFVFLAREGYYNGLTWHRVVKDFVIQGGDPKGDGTGGPGYKFEDELPTDGYQIGSLAMANSGPDTNGSQFFIVTGSKGAALDNSYSRFGNVSEGVEVAQKLESFAQEDQKPSRKLYIFEVTITES